MNADDHVCLCHRVSLRKLVNYLNREEPGAASQLSDCLGAGTGCGWCVPYLEKMHEQWEKGESPELGMSVEEYGEQRREYNRKKREV